MLYIKYKPDIGRIVLECDSCNHIVIVETQSALFTYIENMRKLEEEHAECRRLDEN